MDPNVVTVYVEKMPSTLELIVSPIITLLAVVLGAAVSLAGSWWITTRKHKQELRDKEAEKEASLQNFYQAVLVEAEAFMQPFINTIDMMWKDLPEGSL